MVPVDLRRARTCVDLIHQVVSSKSTRGHRSRRILFLGEKPNFYSRPEIPVDWLSLRRDLLKIAQRLPCDHGFDLTKNHLILNLGQMFSGAPVLSRGHWS